MREIYVGEKYRWKKVRKHVFYIHTNIVTKKWGEKNARNNFSRNTKIVRAKNVRKKSSEKSAKKRFLLLREYRDLKWAEITREAISPETHQ